MSTIGLTPIRMLEVTVAIEADDYTTSVNQVILTPDTVAGWGRGLSEMDASPHLVGVRWSVAIGFAQDLATPGSLSVYLVENAGQRRRVQLTAAGRTITVDALILPAQIGGVANQIPAAVVTMPIYGAPTLGE